METSTVPMTSKVSPAAKTTFLILSIILNIIGGCGGPLITRLYFIHGGSRVWFSSFTQMAGFPFTILVLIILYFIRLKNDNNNKNKTATFIYMRLRLFLSAAFVGAVIIGVDTYLYTFGVARLPVSTSSLIISSQLSFTAFFAFLLVKQKFTPYSVNALVLLTIGAGVLALSSNSDRPKGESKNEYLLGFMMTLGAALLVGFMMPLIELAYNKAKQMITFTIVMEFQLVLCFFASIFSLVGMVVNGDFKVIPNEAREFELGKTEYYIILFVSALVWQCSYLGAFGIIFCSSSLLSGIVNAALLPVTEVLAVLFYKEKFQVEKGVALVLSLWGFASYFYGEYKLTKELKDSKHSSQPSIDSSQINNSSV